MANDICRNGVPPRSRTTTPLPTCEADLSRREVGWSKVPTCTSCRAVNQQPTSQPATAASASSTALTASARPLSGWLHTRRRYYCLAISFYGLLCTGSRLETKVFGHESTQLQFLKVLIWPHHIYLRRNKCNNKQVRVMAAGYQKSNPAHVTACRY